MKVKIKRFDVEMEVKNSGIEFEIRSPDGTKQLGDMQVTKSGLEWHKGKSSSGPKKTWQQVIDWMNS